MDNVECTGAETSLLNCSYIPTHNCIHDEDVVLECGHAGKLKSALRSYL